MTATILSGRDLAKTMRQDLAAEVAEFEAKYGFAPTIAVVRAGDDPASVSYGGAIERSFGKRGLGFSLHALPGTATQGEIVELVATLNADDSVHGIMVHGKKNNLRIET